MKAIGGYFGLELSDLGEYHTTGIRLNTGRNALEYILLSQEIKKIYIPYFTCDVILEPLEKHGIEIAFYEIDEKFEPVFQFGSMHEEEAFLYTNYFGLKDTYVNQLAKQCSRLIIDNSQSFYSKPLPGVSSFNSARKFFGVPDGAYLFSANKLEVEIQEDFSYHRFEHLLKRVDISPEEGYNSFLLNDRSLNNNPIRHMSTLTRKLLSGINYEEAAFIRKQNFNQLHKALHDINNIYIEPSSTSIPMIYPFWSNDSELRERLLKKKIYTPVFWPNVLKWRNKNTLEHKMTKEIVYLPIDQRYSKLEMDFIISQINLRT